MVEDRDYTKDTVIELLSELIQLNVITYTESDRLMAEWESQRDIHKVETAQP